MIKIFFHDVWGYFDLQTKARVFEFLQDVQSCSSAQSLHSPKYLSEKILDIPYFVTLTKNVNVRIILCMICASAIYDLQYKMTIGRIKGDMIKLITI